MRRPATPPSFNPRFCGSAGVRRLGIPYVAAGQTGLRLRCGAQGSAIVAVKNARKLPPGGLASPVGQLPTRRCRAAHSRCPEFHSEIFRWRRPTPLDVRSCGRLKSALQDLGQLEQIVEAGGELNHHSVQRLETLSYLRLASSD